MKTMTTRSSVSQALQTKTSKKRKLSLLNQPSITPQKATLPRKVVGKADMAIGKTDKATRKVAVAITKGTMTVKDGKVAKETSGAIAKTVIISPIAHTNNMEMVKINLITTGTKDKGAEEVDPAKKEASATSQETFMTFVKSTTNLRLIRIQTTVSITATTMTFS